MRRRPASKKQQLERWARTWRRDLAAMRGEPRQRPRPTQLALPVPLRRPVEVFYLR